jgi:hypothetical protein
MLGCVRIEGEGSGAVGKEEVCAGADPANPKNIKSEVESFLQQAMTIGVHEVLEGEDEAKSAGDEENCTDDVCHLFRRAFTHDIEGKDERELEEGQDGKGQPKDAEPVVLMIGGGDPDLANRGDLGDQIRFVPAEEDLGEEERQEATART